jgi:uncharacterized protein YndB with AHSA1/START domain
MPSPMKQPMKILLIVVLAVVGLAALVTLAGMFLPRQHAVSSVITLKQPIDTVYATLRDIGGMTKWWGDLKVSERVAGAPGERWRQESGGDTMQLDVVDAAPPRGFTTRIVEDKGAPFGGEWVYALSPSKGGTTVTVTENGWIGPPPFRVIAQLMGLHRTMDGMLVALGTHFGENVKPAHR